MISIAFSEVKKKKQTAKEYPQYCNLSCEKGEVRKYHESVHLHNSKYRITDEKLKRLVTYRVWLGTMWQEGGADGNTMD